MKNQCLRGLAFLLCRPAEKVEGLKARLEAEGAKVDIFSPLIYQALPYELSRPFVEKLFHFDWLIFSSSQGVSVFGRHIEKYFPQWISDSCPFQLAVVGKKTASKIHGVFPLWPIRSLEKNIQTLLQKIAQCQSQAKKEVKILHPTSIQSLEKISPLVPSGLEWNRIPFYKTLANIPSEEEIQTLSQATYNLALFGSPSCFDSFRLALGKEIFSRIGSLATLGKTTSQYIENQGFSVEVIPPSPDEESLLQTLLTFGKSLKNRSLL